jgi:hypothetical protein
MSNPVSRIATTDGLTDEPDHEISLVDTTVPDTACSRNGSPSRPLSRKATKSSIRARIANRKYAKWREDKFANGGGVATNENDEDDAHTEDGPSEAADGKQAEQTEAVDFADRGRQPKQKRRRHEQYEIDVLYENQRGSFFLGIPLYSQSSLLNFDPGAWVTRDFKDSAVNITNAQVPDPSWQWVWKRWYVDMSHDVDEEGWQYSFMFGSKFVWHGTHPWFHSFVRRRRWLRKRVKKHTHIVGGIEKAETMSTAHQLNTDYFTIHPKRNRSPDSKRPESYASVTTSTQLEEPPDEIKDIATLLKALKLAAVDREKIDIVKKFINQGGEELAYLGSRIPDIMSSLVFQTSKTQLLSFLKDTTDTAQAHRDEHDAEDRPEAEEERRRIDNLLAAVEAADQQITGLEYWSDRKHVLKTVDGANEWQPRISTIFDVPVPEPQRDDDPAAGIKGISSEAEVDVDQTRELMHNVHQGEPHKNDAKGKGKEKETRTGSTERKESPPRLKADQVLIPVDD